MRLKMFKKLMLISGLLVTSNVCAVTWTANIKSVTVFPSGKATITLDNLVSPNPAGSSWDCTNGVVLLGDPANSALVSISLAQYTTKTQVRIGISGTGSSCQASYIGGL